MSEGERGARLVAEGVSKAYRSGDRVTPVLQGVDLQLAPGDMAAITGPSGSGKSTLLHLLGALDRPDEGRIEVDGVAVGDLDDEGRARLRNEAIGFVFQFHHLLPDFTALENVAMPGRVAGIDRAACEGRAQELIARVGLEHRGDHYPSELSGGERQRVAICRALALRPRLVLADEPTGNLDHEAGEGVMALLTELQAELGTTAVVVTHDPKVAARCGRIFELVGGNLSELVRSA